MSIRFVVSIAAASASALLALGTTRPAAAQGYSEGGGWYSPRYDTPRPLRRPPSWSEQYDASDDDPEWTPPRRRYRDGRDEDEQSRMDRNRDDDEDSRRDWRREAPWREGPRRAARPPQPEEREQLRDEPREDDAAAGGNAKPAGVDGGTRPYIEPKAPAMVAFSGGYAPGTIVIDTNGRKLYYVVRPTAAYAYPIGVGREGFSWTGSEKVSRIQDWPDWYPPAEMRQRKPELPERMLGGLNNPLGVKAIYLGNTLYRIHGTNDPKSIGRAESSGCFRMLNAHVLHLASLVQIGTQVTVVRSLTGSVVASEETQRPRATARPAAAPRWQYRPRPRWYETYDDYR